MSPHKINNKCCCDPFKQHKKSILLSLRTLPKFVVENSDPKYNFSDESKVCVNCLKKINKYAKSVKELFRLFRLPEEIGSSESTVTSPESTIEPKEEDTVTSPDPKEDTVTSPDPKEEDPVTSPDPKKDTVTSPDPEEEDIDTSPDPKEENTVTSPDPKEENTVTSPDPKEEDADTSPDPKEENTVTSPVPKEEDTITSPDPKKEDTVTSPDPKEEDAPLEQTDATPVDLDGLNSESKSKSVSAKHKKSSASRKRKLETEVQDVEPLEKEPLVESDLERYEKLMNDLTEEFKSTSLNKRKLQILTLSPFSVSRTMDMFGATKQMVDKARRLKDKYGVIPEIPDN